MLRRGGDYEPIALGRDISYLRYALRSRNYAALIYVVIMLVVMLIEVITCLSQYLIAMSLMAAFLISTHPYLQKK